MNAVAFAGEKPLNLALRLLLGGLFVFSGLTKIIEPAAFATDVGNYRLLPHATIHLLAITLPWVELLAGLMLALGIWTRASAMVISVLMIVFTIAVSQALARGLDIKCGCFGTATARKAGLETLALDLTVLAVAAWLVWRTKD
jgi:putative oxidoreductase